MERGTSRCWRPGVVAVLVAFSTTAAAEAPPEPVPAGGPAPAAGIPYWQAPALPTAVIQGGAIPPGWQPQAVPYHGIGPDGRPLTMYFAPTYVFTFQSGPPVLALPQGPSGGWVAAGTTTGPSGGGWNYATSGVAPVTPVLPPAAVAR